jgi:hypothetical protein
MFFKLNKPSINAMRTQHQHQQHQQHQQQQQQHTRHRILQIRRHSRRGAVGVVCGGGRGGASHEDQLEQTGACKFWNCTGIRLQIARAFAAPPGTISHTPGCE